MDSKTAVAVLKQIENIILRDPSWLESTRKPIEEIFDMAIQAIEEQDALNIVRCNECKYYDGVHKMMGHAPCKYWKAGSVLSNWYCSQGEPDYTDELVDLEADTNHYTKKE